MVDLAIVIVSTNDAPWLERCLQSVLDQAVGVELEVVVVDNESTDNTRHLVESKFPWVQVVDSPNRGFAHGNNVGVEHTHARYVLLLNPDTEVIEGTFEDLLCTLDARPDVGVVGVCQLAADGALSPTICRSPSVARAVGEALFSERWPLRPAWAGERVLDWSVYARETDCDWVLGSFLLVRREALLSAGVLDERFFLYSEEPDFCRRVREAGWQVRHLPQMTIVHHIGKAGIRPRMVAQETFARMQYARKYFGPAHRYLYAAALGLRHVLRVIAAVLARERTDARRQGAWLSLRILLGRLQPPFVTPPATAARPKRARLPPRHDRP